jgi:hypothetical protein
MDTKPLERFATQARRDLLAAVDAQATVVLNPGSVARSERAEVVKKLESEIGRQGRQHVVDKVAYTWFNRIIALRFMDARGYTDAGVVSPAQGQVHGQPEILADAKRGNLDVEVIMNSRTADAIVGLLDGTRRSTDAEGEAYALLLTEYCRYWHKSMPFMFEREGDYTELLVPANLLAANAILARAREALTKDVCDDVEVIGWLYQFYISERKKKVFDGFSAKGTARRLAGPEEIPAATQLFTPHWIVRYLVENSLGRLWMLNRPTSRLVDQMRYYISPVDEELNLLKISKPDELMVIDPACGSGHMLTYAFDLLYAIYEEEGYAQSDIPGLILTHNLHGTEIDPRAGALAAFALTMKARAKQRTFFNRKVGPNICVIEPILFSQDELDLLITRRGDHYEESAFWNQFAEADTLGSLVQTESSLTARLGEHLATLDAGGDMLKADALERAARAVVQAEYLLPRYNIVVANPPYMGTRNMSDALRQFAEREYPASSGDLCTMFIDRSLDLVCFGGLTALVVSESWLFNTSYEEMRRGIVRRARLLVTACIDKSAFGVRLNTAASVLERGASDASSQFFRVTQDHLSAGPLLALPPRGGEVYAVEIDDFARVPGGAFIFDMPRQLLELYGKTEVLGQVFEARQGLATGNNNRFLRYWWEVSRAHIAYGIGSIEESQESANLWFPYNKGGSPVPWWGNQDHVIAFNTENYKALSKLGNKLPSRKKYFKSSVTWSNIGSAGARFRYLPPGFVFDVAGMSIFSTNDEDQLSLLGYLNSSLIRDGLDVLAPTLNYQVGDVARLPLVMGNDDNDRVGELIDLCRAAWVDSETAHEFQTSPLVRDDGQKLGQLLDGLRRERQARSARIAELERASDEYWLERVAEISTHDPSNRPSHAPRRSEVISIGDDIEALVSYAVGCMFGRYSINETGLVIADQGSTLDKQLARMPNLTFTPDMDNVIPFVDDGWFEDDIVERFRHFLRAAFGREHFEVNLRFIEDSLGVKSLREYFITKGGRSRFYDDHVKRYRTRPIYWMFSSPKGSFNALIYMHRYTPSTVSIVLNEYLREYRAKLEVALANAELAEQQMEADRLRRVLVELAEYEHDVLYPLATQQMAIDLDDGVRTNYPKFYPALRKIAGLEATE